MSILSGPTDAVSGVIGGINGLVNSLLNPFSRDVGSPPPPDFPEGFKIEEEVTTGTAKQITLSGNMMPMIPFETGGTQRINKQFYPGNPIPSIQVLGPEEKDLVIKGVFKDKRVKDVTLKPLAKAMQDAIEVFRYRGNLLRLSMGNTEFVRYGYILDTKFGMKNLRYIEYEITFLVVSINKPLRKYQITNQKMVPFEINTDLVNAATAFGLQYSSVPASMPQSIAGLLNEITSEIANVLHAVTSFVDDVVGAVEDIGQALNRAAGLVLYAQTEIWKIRRRLAYVLASLIQTSENLGLTVTDKYRNVDFVMGITSDTHSFSDYLAKLRDRFASIRATVPLARHRIVDKETLQKIAMKYYSDSTAWEKIYDHNELNTTELEVGSVIEIPRL